VHGGASRDRVDDPAAGPEQVGDGPHAPLHPQPPPSRSRSSRGGTPNWPSASSRLS
jgi:hypothetical protein